MGAPYGSGRSGSASGAAGGAGEAAQEGDGVLGTAAALDLEVEVGSGGAAAGSRQGDDGAAVELLSLADTDLGEVGVDGADATVVEDDHLPVPAHGAGEGDASGRHGADGGSGGDGNVHPPVQLEVETAASEAEGRGKGAVDRPSGDGAAGDQEEGGEREKASSHGG